MAIEIDASLCPSIRYSTTSNQKAVAVRTAFLTGATGFLGANLLRDLLTQTSLEVRCLVRALHEAEAMSRIEKSLQRQGLWCEPFRARIRAVVGDLGKPGFGLPDNTFAWLGAEVDVVYHCAAQINLILPYRAVRTVNVKGTQEVLRFAAIKPASAFHHVSTLAVFGSQPYRKEVIEDFSVANPEELLNGYAKSKLFAERLVNQASDRGLSVAIYRPGVIMGHSKTGVCNFHDALTLLLRACMKVAAVPECYERVPITPVDFVSRAIVELSQMAASRGKAFHLINGRSSSWQDIAGTMVATGCVRTVLPYEEWFAEVRRKGRETQDHELELVLALLSNSSPAGDNMFRVRTENAESALLTVPEAHCEKDSSKLLKTYLTYLGQTL